MIEAGLPPHPPGKLMLPSPYLNIYAYPEELDYLDVRPLPENWARFDHFIRFGEKDASFTLPEDFVNDGSRGKLVYVSMGSMGCADDRLMKRLITILAKSPNRFIFSMGPQHGKLELASNMIGYKFLPQTQVLPLVDLVISHGGNNTFLESLYFGKPLLITPLFGDQMDNGQRVLEKGVGDRVNPYQCEPQELLNKVENLLSNQDVRNKVQLISQRMQSSNSTLKAAIEVERIALTGPNQ